MDVDMKTKAKIRGRVKWCNEKKGYGFLTLPDGSGGGDLFYHVNSVIGEFEPRVDDEVSFVVVERNGRPEAAQIEILGDTAKANDGEPEPPTAATTPATEKA
jgi:cold shock CspA family protein